jgi:hypothetical protein
MMSADSLCGFEGKIVAPKGNSEPQIELRALADWLITATKRA